MVIDLASGISIVYLTAAHIAMQFDDILNENIIQFRVSY